MSLSSGHFSILLAVRPFQCHPILPTGLSHAMRGQSLILLLLALKTVGSASCSGLCGSTADLPTLATEKGEWDRV